MSNFNDEPVKEDDGEGDSITFVHTSTFKEKEPFCNKNEKGARCIAPLLVTLGVNYVELSDEKVHVLIGELVRIQMKKKKH